MQVNHVVNECLVSPLHTSSFISVKLVVSHFVEELCENGIF